MAERTVTPFVNNIPPVEWEIRIITIIVTTMVIRDNIY